MSSQQDSVQEYKLRPNKSISSQSSNHQPFVFSHPVHSNSQAIKADNHQQRMAFDQISDDDIHPNTQSSIPRGGGGGGQLLLPQSQISSQYASVIHFGEPIRTAGKDSLTTSSNVDIQQYNNSNEKVDYLQQGIKQLIMKSEEFSQMLYKGDIYRNEIAPYGNVQKVGKFTGGYYPREVHGLSGGMKKATLYNNLQSANKASSQYQSEEQRKEKQRIKNKLKVEEGKRLLEEKISKKLKQQQIKEKELEKIKQQKQRQKLLQAKQKKKREQQQKQRQKQEKKLISKKESMTQLIQRVAQTGKIQEEISSVIHQTPHISNTQLTSGNQDIIRGEGVISQSSQDLECKILYQGRKIDMNQQNQINPIRQDLYDKVMNEINESSKDKDNNAVVELMSAQEQDSANQIYSQHTNNLRYSDNSVEQQELSKENNQQCNNDSPLDYLTQTMQHNGIAGAAVILQTTTAHRQTVPDLGSSTVNEQVIKAAGTGSGFDLQQLPTINQHRYSRQDILLQLSRQREIDQNLQNHEQIKNHMQQNKEKEEDEKESSTDLERQIFSHQSIDSNIPIRIQSMINVTTSDQ